MIYVNRSERGKGFFLFYTDGPQEAGVVSVFLGTTEKEAFERVSGAVLLLKAVEEAVELNRRREVLK